MKTIVIEGGGADGAITAGRLSVLNPDYTLAVGTSTGTLKLILILLRKWGILKEAEVTADTTSVFNKNPFKKNGRPHILKIVVRSLLSLFTKRNTVGESKALRALIERTVTQADYDALRAKKKTAIATCHSLTYDDTRYFSSQEESFEDFKDWMWISANVPIVMSLVEKNNEQWADGGISEGLPLTEAIRRGATDIDVFMHSPRPVIKRKKDIKNVFHFFLRLVGSFFRTVGKNNLDEGLLAAEIAKAVVRIHWLDKEYYDNPLTFGRDKMEHLYEVGRRLATDPTCTDVHDFR